MRPVIIGIGGSQSGAGKTTIACKIIRSLKGWGAIKYTKTFLYSSIVDDPEILSEEGKDTRRFLDSGAEKVVWVQSPFSELDQILPLAVGMLSSLKGIVVEGNSAIDILRPDIVIFVSGSEGKIKSSAKHILQMSDVVIFGEKTPPETPESVKKFSRDDVDGYIRYIRDILDGYKEDE